MLASVTAAVSSLEVVLFGKYDQPFFIGIVILTHLTYNIRISDIQVYIWQGREIYQVYNAWGKDKALGP